MSIAERVFDWTLALSAWSWAALGLAHAAPDDRFTVVRLGIAALHLVVGGLVLRRTRLERLGDPAQLAAALPALVISGVALKLAPLPHCWPIAAQLVFGIGLVLTIASLLSLGRDFAILPALRGVQTRGPYALVRHPAYLGELMLLLACGLAGPPLHAWPVLAALPLVALRIHAEERLLERSFAWCSYREQVRWRLIPRIW